MSDTGRKKSFLGEITAPLLAKMPEIVSMSLFINVLSLAVPIFVLQVYDRVVFQAGLTTLQGLVIGVLLAVLFDFVLRQVRGRIIQRIAVRLDAKVGRMLFDKMAALPLSVIESKTMPQWQMLHRDTEAVRNVCAGPPVALLVDLPFVFVFIAVIWIIAQPIAWILTIIVPVFMIVAALSQRMISHNTEQEKNAQMKRDALVAEMIAGRTTMKALGLGSALSNRWEERQSELVVSSIRRGTLTDSFTHIGMSLGLIASIAMTSVGALAIIDQELTMGALIAANMLTNKIIGPMNQLVGTWRQLVGFRQSAARLGDLFDIPDEAGAGAMDRPRPVGEIRLEGVSYAYGKDGPPVLQGVDIDFGANQVHGVIGANGSGKTTLLKVAQRLYRPTEGRVLIDGVDTDQLSRPQLSSWIGYVPQDPFLFGGTIKENIAKGREGVPDEVLLAAAESAGVQDFADELPEGFETDIGEAGRRLSAGQRQRIAVARALIDDPPILLLDEPSASLDRGAEEKLGALLKALSDTRTIVVVSHSPSLLRICDTITVLNKGAVALTGEAERVLDHLKRGAGLDGDSNRKPEQQPQPRGPKSAPPLKTSTAKPPPGSSEAAE
ncbi:MAG: ATP-binding cassette domain-containing protein [Alphaproteobacteria bacterium]